MPIDLVDTIYTYRGFWGCEARCRLRIARRPAGDVVIASELPDNAGTSITNMAEQLATMARQFGLDPARLTWIEHYGADPDLDRDESYDLVQFAWDGARFSAPRWKRVARAAVERLIGQPLSDGAAAAPEGAAARRAGNEEAPMLADGQWYTLPDGTRVQARAGYGHLAPGDQR